MPRPDDHPRPALSLLDRLLDDDPEQSRDPPQWPAQLLRQLQEAVRRDLANLLNTRPPPWSLPEPPGLLAQSLLDYGLPDPAWSPLVSPGQRQQFQQQIEELIRAFEPRLSAVRITLPNDPESGDRVWRCQIEGLLRVEPEPEPISYLAEVQPETGEVSIQGAKS